MGSSILLGVTESEDQCADRRGTSWGKDHRHVFSKRRYKNLGKSLTILEKNPIKNVAQIYFDRYKVAMREKTGC
jgi:hypothetical protein